MQSQELPEVVHNGNVCSFDHFRTTDSGGLEICCCAESGAILQVMSYEQMVVVSLQWIELQARYANLRGVYTARSSRHFLVICACRYRQDCAGNHRPTEIWLSTSFGFHHCEQAVLGTTRCAQDCVECDLHKPVAVTPGSNTNMQTPNSRPGDAPRHLCV